MKKSFLGIVIALFMVTAFSSCKPDDEIYTRDCKISKIWYRSNVGDPSEKFNYDEKGVLTDIEIDTSGSFTFSYNKDKTVSNIVHVGKDYTESVDLTYIDRLVSKMVYTVDDTIRLVAEITRDEETDRIASVTENYDKMFFDRFAILYKCPLFNRFIGNVKDIHELAPESQSKDLTLRCTKTFTYYPGDHKKYENLESVSESYPDIQKEITRTYTYDTETFNPFYGLPYVYADYAGYYLNNKLTENIITKTAGHESSNVKITYNYEGTHYLNDKQYPRQFITTSSVNNIPIHTYILYVK